MPCKMCGLCCKAIPMMGMSPEYFKEQAEKYKVADETNDVLFIHENWELILEQEVQKVNPEFYARLEARRAEYAAQGYNVKEAYWYRCKLLTEDNKCPLQGDKKPHVCAGYPWYGSNPNTDIMLMNSECGYLEELNKHLEEQRKASEDFEKDFKRAYPELKNVEEEKNNELC